MKKTIFAIALAFIGITTNAQWTENNGTLSTDTNITKVRIGNVGWYSTFNVDGRLFIGKHSNGSGITYQPNAGGDWFAGLDYSDSWGIRNGSSNFFYIKNDGRVGIGTPAPMAKLHINGRIYLGDHNNGSGVWYKSPIGSSGTDWFVGLKSNNAWRIFKDGHDKLTILSDGNVGIGTTNPGSWKLAVLGKIRATEIKVEAEPWSDFVFYEDYDLPTLDEVEQHIKEKGHLKDIPSAEEVGENGIFLGEMNAKLLQKIEELTLYTIQQEKQIKVQQEKEIKEKRKIELLEERLENLEQLIRKIDKQSQK